MRTKKISEQSFDDVVEDMITKKKLNLTHGDNAEQLQVPQNDLAYYQSLGKKLNEQWLR